MEYHEALPGIDLQVEDFIPPLVAALEDAGFSTVRSFDLRSACAPLDAPCPHHGLRPCNRQLVVLLVYDWIGSLYCLTIHGMDDHCDITLTGTETKATSQMDETIRLIIEMTREGCEK
jgi:hypothetical protein